jgi:hypothetical protein
VRFDLDLQLVVFSYKFLCLSLFVFFRWTNIQESARSGMAVLDVAIPTGYIIQQQKLDWYIRSRQVRNLQRARYLERKVLFYFDYVSVPAYVVSYICLMQKNAGFLQSIGQSFSI